MKTRIGLVLLLGTLGAAPSPPTLQEITAKLEELNKRFWDNSKRMDAILAELRDIRATFPSSADPEGVLRRRQALVAEAGVLSDAQWNLRSDHRKNLAGVYVYQSTLFLKGVRRGEGPSAPVAGQFYVYEKAVTEMKTASSRFNEDLRTENARFQTLARSYQAAKSARRSGRAGAAGILAAAALAGGLFLARRRIKAVPEPTPAADRALSRGSAASDVRGAARGLIGRGTLGDVLERTDAKSGRRIALKVLRPELLAEPEALERLLAGARAVSALSHPNIAALHCIERAGAQVCLAYEFIEGKTVLTLLQQRRRLAWSESLGILKGSAAALRHAHGRGLTHRDLKPANIMLTPANAVKVLDFSIVDKPAGMPPYMAPEQQQGAVSPAVDLYALSVIFYEMLTGELPFKGPNYLAQKREALYAPPTGLVAGLPRGVDAFFKTALAPQPSRRFAAAEALAAAAEAA